MDDNLFDKDRVKAAQFLNAAETGAIQAGLNPKQREKVNQYVIDQRNKYVNAAWAASSGRFNKKAPAYIELIQEMNQVKTNLSNLANQQKAVAENQQQYLDDFQSDRISKANYDPNSPSVLMDVYTGNADLQIDEGGNLMFGKDGQFKRYSDIADYTLKATDTANTVLNVADKLAASRYRVPNASLKLQKNRIKSIIDKGGRKSLLSLIQDDLLPGFSDIEIPQELYKPENYSNLKNFFLSTLDNALDDVNNSLPQNPKFIQKTSLPSKESPLNPLPKPSKIGGKTQQERAAIAKAAGDLLKTGKTQGVNEYKFTYKGSNDANTQKYILTVDDNKNLMFRIDTPGSEFVPISQEDLIKELGFSPTEGMTASEKIEYYKNKKS
jgi:hypothetical protein